jgi:hypothetical protein
MPREATQIVRGWLDEVSFSAATWNLDAHMQLVSRQVMVTGIPSISHIDYEGWKLRRKNEFDNKLLHSLTYRLHDILSEEEDQILFSVEETMKSSKGKSIVVDKEVMLRKEEDGIWRVHHERFDRIQLR